MTRTEVIGDCTLMLGDCLDVIGEFSDVACIITDPPYGISHPCDFGSRKRGEQCGRDSRGRPVWISPKSNDYPDVHGDDKPFDPAPLIALDVPTVLWGGNHYSDKLPPQSGWLVWDKLRPDTLDQSTCELAWTNCVKGVRRFRHLWNGMMRASEHGDNYHPTQKPVALFRWILSLPWIPGGTVFDPYMGAGPMAVACVQHGRPYIGCEIVPEYFNIACKRIREAVGIGSLFCPERAKEPELYP